MSIDLAKYRAIFVEEATEHLAEMSSALLELEKDPQSGEAIDQVFRMAHSIKGMAASLEYDAVSELAHRLEDRMQVHRAAGHVPGGDELALLFRGLDALDAMVASVRETGEPPAPNAEVTGSLASTPTPSGAPDVAAKKKLLP